MVHEFDTGFLIKEHLRSVDQPCLLPSRSHYYPWGVACWTWKNRFMFLNLGSIKAGRPKNGLYKVTRAQPKFSPQKKKCSPYAFRKKKVLPKYGKSQRNRIHSDQTKKSNIDDDTRFVCCVKIPQELVSRGTILMIITFCWWLLKSGDHPLRLVVYSHYLRGFDTSQAVQDYILTSAK